MVKFADSIAKNRMVASILKFLRGLLKRLDLPFVIVLLISFLIWIVFYPAYMNADSLSQYNQGLLNKYDDWHPAIMSVIVHYVLLLGGGIGVITLLQILAGCFGVCLLSREILRVTNVSSSAVKWYPLFLLLFLLTPLSSLPFYMMGFIKDSWLGLELIWVAYLTLKARQLHTRESAAYRRNYVLLVLSMNMVLLTRHNALVLVPVFFLILYTNGKRLRLSGESKLSLIFWGSIPLLLFLFSQNQLYISFKVERSFPENQVYVLESVGALVDNPANGKYVPYVKSHLTPAYKDAYIPGNVTPVMFWAPIPALDTLFNRDNPLVKQQYFDLLKNAPFTLLKVKWEGFAKMLDTDRSRYLFHTQLDSNDLGLSQNARFAGTRAIWQGMTRGFQKNYLTDLILDEHVVWLVINILLLIVFIRRRVFTSGLFLLLLLPLVYYFSYLLAATTPDFRMMFPATFLMEVLGLSLLLVKWDRYQQSR
jgi:hypothetical protein